MQLLHEVTVSLPWNRKQFLTALSWSWTFKPFQVLSRISPCLSKSCKRIGFSNLDCGRMRASPLSRTLRANWNTNCLVRDKEGQRQKRKRSRWVSDEVSWLSLFSLVLRMIIVKVKALSLHCWAGSGKHPSRRHCTYTLFACMSICAEQLHHLHAPQWNRSVRQRVI